MRFEYEPCDNPGKHTIEGTVTPMPWPCPGRVRGGPFAFPGLNGGLDTPRSVDNWWHITWEHRAIWQRVKRYGSTFTTMGFERGLPLYAPSVGRCEVDGTIAVFYPARGGVLRFTGVSDVVVGDVQRGDKIASITNAWVGIFAYPDVRDVYNGQESIDPVFALALLDEPSRDALPAPRPGSDLVGAVRRSLETIKGQADFALKELSEPGVV